MYLATGRLQEKMTMQEQRDMNDSLRNYVFSRDDLRNLRVSEPAVDVKNENKLPSDNLVYLQPKSNKTFDSWVNLPSSKKIHI